MERIWNVFEICVSENFEKACLGLSIKMASKAAQKDFNPTVYCTVGNTCIYARACARARAYTHTHTHTPDPFVEVTFRLVCFQCFGKPNASEGFFK